MAENKLIAQVRLVCSCDQKLLTSQIADMDRGDAERLNTYFERLQGLYKRYQEETVKATVNPLTEKRLKDTMNKMGELVVDHVFAYENSNTAEMAELFAGLGYADGDAEHAKEQLNALRDFGYEGKLAQAFSSAGEMSDHAIPVMESLRELQEEFSSRKGKNMAESSGKEIIGRSELNRLKNACRKYLEIQGTHDLPEIRAVRMALETAEQTEKHFTSSEIKEGKRERTSFSDIMREKETAAGVRIPAESRMHRWALDLQEKKRKKEPQL